MTPILCVPGTLCDERVFGPMLTFLDGAEATPPIAHGRVEDAADRLLADAPPRFLAVGFSLGAFVVLELLRRAPERLAGALLIAGNVFPLAQGQAQARRRDVAIAREQGTEAVIQAYWPRYVAPSLLNDAGLRRTVDDMAASVGPDLFAAQAELAITRPDSRDTVRDTAVPLLALCGEEDGMCPPERCGAIGGNARVEMLPGVGHFIPLEAPDAAANAIRAWAGALAPCC